MRPKLVAFWSLLATLSVACAQLDLELDGVPWGWRCRLSRVRHM
jgi:hypothetical protein